MNKAPAVLALMACVIVLASACKKEQAKIVATPPDYVMVDSVYGLNQKRITAVGDTFTAPIMEKNAGGGYALYPITTNCIGMLARGAGTVFTADGSVLEHTKEQSPFDLKTSPQYEALIKQICAGANKAKSIGASFDPDKAMELIYGKLDDNREALQVLTTEDDAKHQFMVSSRKQGEFLDGGERKMYLITGSRDPECDSHACGGGPIGAAIFKKTADGWTLEGNQPDIVRTGAYGAAPDPQSIISLRAGNDLPVLRVNGICFGNGGECATPVDILVYANGRFLDAWSGDASVDTTATTWCESDGKCSDYQSAFEVAKADPQQVPQLIIMTKGKEWDDDAEKLFKIDQTQVFNFDLAGGKYLEQSKTGGKTEIPLTVSTDNSEAEVESLDDDMQNQSDPMSQDSNSTSPPNP